MDSDLKVTPKQTEETPTEPPRPKIIRNRDVDKMASTMAEDHLLPLPPGRHMGWDQMQQYLALLTPAMWSHVLIYVYRVKPKIRRQLKDPNSPNYIDCLSEPFTMDYFISRHGGGRYNLQAVDSDGRKGGESSQLFKCNFDINDVQYPPILNYEELELDARENKSYITWLQNKGILDGKGNVIQPPSGQPGTPASAVNNLSAKEVLDILGYAHKMSTESQAQFRAQFAPGEDSLSKSVGTILLEKMKQDDPGKDWDRMMSFIQMSQSHKPDPGIAQILQMQQEQNKTNLEYTKLLLQNQNQNSSKSQFGEFREIISFAREIWQAGSGAGRRSNWDTGLEIARDVVLPGLQAIGGTIAQIMALRNGVPPGLAATAAAAGARPAGAFDPYANPQALRQHSQTVTAQQPQQNQTPQPPQQPQPPGPMPPPPPGTNPELFGLFAQYGNLVVNALNNGTPGYDFADYVAGLLGNATHAMLAGQGEEPLVTTMLAIPEIAIFGEPRLRAFVNEFVHYHEYLSQQEQEPEEEPEPEVIESPKIYRPPQHRTAAAPRQ